MRKTPFTEGTFIVCSAVHPRWLKYNSQDEVIWTKHYRGAERFDYKSFQQMLIDNKWLESSDLWFQR